MWGRVPSHAHSGLAHLAQSPAKLLIKKRRHHIQRFSGLRQLKVIPKRVRQGLKHQKLRIYSGVQKSQMKHGSVTEQQVASAGHQQLDVTMNTRVSQMVGSVGDVFPKNPKSAMSRFGFHMVTNRRAGGGDFRRSLPDRANAPISRRADCEHKSQADDAEAEQFSSNCPLHHARAWAVSQPNYIFSL